MSIGSISVVTSSGDNLSGNSLKELYRCSKDSDVSDDECGSYDEITNEESDDDDHETLDEKNKKYLYLPSYYVRRRTT